MIAVATSIANDASGSRLAAAVASAADRRRSSARRPAHTSDAVTTPRIDEMYAESRRLGAVGGKVSGAGGGGFMFLYCPFDCRPVVAERLRALGGEILPMAFAPEGKSKSADSARPSA